MNEKEFNELVEKVGQEAAKKIKSETEAIEARYKQMALDASKNGGVSKEDFESYKTAADEAVSTLKEIAKKQGISIADLTEKLTKGEVGVKSISEVLEENKEELEKIYKQGSGNKTFMVQTNSKGEFVMRPFDATKAAGPHATIGDVGAPGNIASISQSIDAASLLRLGGNSPIISQFRNTPWVFDLVNVTNAGYGMPLAMWYEEKVKQGGSNLVPEGGSKPISQYEYELKTATYKKEATLIGFTEEFSLDFARLQSDILGKGRTDTMNNLNARILARMNNAASAYNTAAQFTQGEAIANVNDFDAIAAMAAQVDNATFGNLANAAIMSTFKKYRMGVTKSTQGEYLNRPDVLNNISFVGNPDMAADGVLTGDLTKYNVLLRGGFIIRVGFNGTDFAENRFSTVLEQYYYDYISDIHKPAIVKGPDFASVKAAIGS
jgi:hypothetical protein